MSTKNSVFIAIPFNESFDRIYKQSIKPAIIDNSLIPFRVDEQIGHRNIVSDIEEGIRNSLLVFGDISTLNANVFYEIGYAKAISKQLIIAKQEGTDAPFDIRQRRYISYLDTDQGLKEFKKKLKEWIKEVSEIARNESNFPKVFCHGTKFQVPDSNSFWNELLKKAESRFYLIGNTNKSWVNKSDLQSEELANSILKIIENKGIVKIMSSDDSNIIEAHKCFFQDFVHPKLRSISGDDGKIIKRLFAQNVKYAVFNHSNYGAVISDNSLIILPTVNSDEFRDETLVLELRGSTSPEFTNYLADIDRMFRNGNRLISEIYNI